MGGCCSAQRSSALEPYTDSSSSPSSSFSRGAAQTSFPKFSFTRGSSNPKPVPSSVVVDVVVAVKDDALANSVVAACGGGSSGGGDRVWVAVGELLKRLVAEAGGRQAMHGRWATKKPGQGTCAMCM